jgi:hypothetical protein
LLGGSPAHELESGALSKLLSRWDTWFVLPRAALVQLLPAMTGMQQLVFGYAGGWVAGKFYRRCAWHACYCITAAIGHDKHAVAAFMHA